MILQTCTTRRHNSIEQH